MSVRIPPREIQVAITYILARPRPEARSEPSNERIARGATARAIFRSLVRQLPTRSAPRRKDVLPACRHISTRSSRAASKIQSSGEFPTGWGWGSVADLFAVTMGQSPPGKTYNEAGDGVPFYQGRSDFGFRFPPRRVYCTAPTRLCRTQATRSCRFERRWGAPTWPSRGAPWDAG